MRTESTLLMIELSYTFFHFQVGNVYVQFREEEHAANALRNLTGRFYAGIFILNITLHAIVHFR